MKSGRNPVGILLDSWTPVGIRGGVISTEGKENVYIADKVGVHKSTVGQILSKMEEHPHPYYQAPHGHQKRILGDRDMR